MAILNLPAAVVPESIPYPIRGGAIRGVRTAIAFILAGVVTSVADGSLLNAVKVVPPEFAPYVTGALGVVLVAIDKWLREKGLVDQAAEDAAGLSLGDSVPDTSVVSVPPPVVNVPPESGDAETGTDAVPVDGPDLADPGDVNPVVFDDPVDTV